MKAVTDTGVSHRRILIVKLRQLGDVLLSTPVFAALKERYPSAEIFAAVNAGTEVMLRGNPNVTGVLFPKPLGSREGIFRRWRKQVGFVREVRGKRFDLVIDLTTSDRSAVLTRLSGASRRIGYRSYKGFAGRSRCYTETVQSKKDEHVVLKHMRSLQPLGFESQKPRLTFVVSDADRRYVRQLLPAGKFFQVHPVSRIGKKNWPVRYVAQSVLDIAAHGWMPVITGSPDPEERQFISELTEELAGRALDLSGKLTLNQVGAVSQEAQCFFGVDTAPMHIAAAVGAPVIALFGPTSERLWAPWCDKKLILSRDLPCRLPCNNKHHCPHIECLRDLTPLMVRQQIEDFLATL